MIQNKIAVRRKEMHMTQKQLAEATGISRTALSAIENGTVPDGAHMLQIAAILKCNVHDIFFVECVV